MQKLRKCIHNPDLGILIFRLFVGLVMALTHGLGKLPPPTQMTDGLATMGAPMPTVLAWCAALAEFGGGLLIAIGLFTRFSAAAMGFTMAVAAFVVHGKDPFNVKELAFFYLVSCILLILTGPGKYSLDSKFCKNQDLK